MLSATRLDLNILAHFHYFYQTRRTRSVLRGRAKKVQMRSFYHWCPEFDHQPKQKGLHSQSKCLSCSSVWHPVLGIFQCQSGVLCCVSDSTVCDIIHQVCRLVWTERSTSLYSTECRIFREATGRRGLPRLTLTLPKIMGRNETA